MEQMSGGTNNDAEEGVEEPLLPVTPDNVSLDLKPRRSNVLVPIGCASIVLFAALLFCFGIDQRWTFRDIHDILNALEPGMSNTSNTSLPTENGQAAQPTDAHSNSAAGQRPPAPTRGPDEEMEDLSLIQNNGTSTAHGGYNSFVFLKFHKVGGTTTGIALSHMAESINYSVSCGLTMHAACITHTALDVMMDKTLGDTPLERLYVRFPESPLLILTLRNPVEKLTSKIFYDEVQFQHPATEESILKRWKVIWHQQHEYLPVMSGGTQNLTLALMTLERFDVVGITANIPAMMAQVAYQLQLPIDHFVYRSAKVVAGRPRFEDLPSAVRNKIMSQLKMPGGAGDMALWERAAVIADERVAQWNLQADIERLQTLVAAYDTQNCDTESHENGGFGAAFWGQWCYEFEHAEPEHD